MKRRRYVAVRPDFTPFVNLALLLIVFFVWHELARKPVVFGGVLTSVCRKGIEPDHANYVLAIVLINKDSLQLCHFPTGSSCRVNFVTAHRHSSTLRKALYRYRRDAMTPGKLAIVIRPKSKSTVGSFVGVLNELRIAGNLPYLVDL